ncbi:MAG TPA: ParB/RepB/Spo0J family partition protein [Candidatus Limnocylindria bacterium]|nr:ParB/RepB/Spo0J family partition protein [Candidatus Limnocylindria bacterium]
MSKGLGRGLDVLIPTDFDETILGDGGDRVQKLLVTDIRQNPDQPRRAFDQQALNELAASIERYGILQPLIVSPRGGKYVLVAGERRWRAARIAGLKQVPAIIRKREELEQLEVALIENVQRVDLAPLEQAVSIEKLHQQFNFSYQAIAERLGKAHSTVHNIVRLLNLPADARTALQKGRITEGHARAILALKNDSNKQVELLNSIMKYGWSVRQAEQFVTSIKKGAEVKKAAKATVSETTGTKSLGERLKTRVTVKRTAKGGRLEIHYKSDEELEALLGRFSQI